MAESWRDEPFEFNQGDYGRGYSAASSLIDTYGLRQTREDYPTTYNFGHRSEDYRLGFMTCLGVAYEKQMEG